MLEKHLTKFRYNENDYPFTIMVEDAINVKKLAKIETQFSIFNEYNDQETYLHKQWYQFADNSEYFQSTYKNFILNHIVPFSTENIVYQTRPTIRFHLQGNMAVGNWHRDSDFGHSPHEINVFLPLTPAFGNNTFWIESEPGKADYAPVEAYPGEYVLFSGATLMHGNKLNNTLRTRVSFDFRFMHKRFYNPDNQAESITTNRKFVIGEYWSEL